MRNVIRRLVGGASLLTVLVAVPSVGWAQAPATNGEVTKELRLPARGVYRNPNRVVQQYDPIADRTRVAVGVASGNPLSIILKPIVQLSFEAQFTRFGNLAHDQYLPERYQ